MDSASQPDATHHPQTKDLAKRDFPAEKSLEFMGIIAHGRGK